MKFIPAKFCYDNKTQYICTTENKETCGNSSVGRVEASQASGREFEPRLPLTKKCWHAIACQHFYFSWRCPLKNFAIVCYFIVFTYYFFFFLKSSFVKIPSFAFSMFSASLKKIQLMM